MSDERCVIPEGRSVKFEAVKDCYITRTDGGLMSPLQLHPGDTLTMVAQGPGPTFVDYRTDEARLVTLEGPETI